MQSLLEVRLIATANTCAIHVGSSLREASCTVVKYLINLLLIFQTWEIIALEDQVAR